MQRGSNASSVADGFGSSLCSGSFPVWKPIRCRALAVYRMSPATQGLTLPSFGLEWDLYTPQCLVIPGIQTLVEAGC